MFWEAFTASTKGYIVKYIDFIIASKSCFTVWSLNGETHQNVSKRREQSIKCKNVEIHYWSKYFIWFFKFHVEKLRLLVLRKAMGCLCSFLNSSVFLLVTPRSFLLFLQWLTVFVALHVAGVGKEVQCLQEECLR